MLNVKQTVLFPALPGRIRSAGLALALCFSLAGNPPGWASADLPDALQKADLLFKQGKAEAAAAIYREYWRQHPESVHSTLQLARIAIRNYDYETAQDILERSLARNPESAEVAATLGYLLMQWMHSPVGEKSGSDARIQEHLQQAAAIDPKNPLVLTYQGEWHLSRQDLVSAERAFREALSVNPRFVTAYQGLTRFYMEAKDISRARDTALHALELDPLNSETYFLLGQLLAIANRPAEAAEYAEKSQQLDFGRRPDRDLFLARQYEQLGEWERAARYYENLTAYAPQNAEIWMRLAQLHAELANPEKSRMAMEQAIRLNPAILDELVEQARLTTRNGDTDAALAAWRKLLPLATDTVLKEEALSAMASLYYHRHLLSSGQPSSHLAGDWQLTQDIPENHAIRLARIKWRIAQAGALTPEARNELLLMTGSPDPAVAGEAYFLLGEYGKAREKLDLVDGLSVSAYGALADRLHLANELHYSAIFYQRANELAPHPSLAAALKRIQAKQALAAQKVDQGNLLFSQKNYTEALEQYRQASRIDPQSSNIYLRLADTQEKLKQWREALDSYETALALTPSLQDSEGLMKHIGRLRKKID